MLLFIPIVLLGMGGLFLPVASDMQEYYVTPTLDLNPDCPNNTPCHTLNEYAQNSSDYFGENMNVSLIFLKGVHNLTSQIFQIRNLNIVILTGINGISNEEAIIESGCEDCYMHFWELNVLTIKDLSIRIGLTTDRVKDFKQMNLVVQGGRMTLYFGNNIVLFDSKYVNNSITVQLSSQMSTAQGSDINITKCEMVDTDLSVTALLNEYFNIYIDGTNIDSQPGQSTMVGLYIYVRTANTTVKLSGSNISNVQNGIHVLGLEQPFVEVIIEDTRFLNTQRGVLIDVSPSFFYNNTLKAIIKQCHIQHTEEAITITGIYTNLELTILDSTIMQALNRGVTIDVGTYPVQQELDVLLQRTSISKCETAIQVQINTESVLTMKVQESEIVNSAHGLSVISQGENWQTDISIVNCNISNNQESGIKFPKTNTQLVSVGANLVRMEVLNCKFTENRGHGVYANVPTNTSFELIIENTVIVDTSGISVEVYGEDHFSKLNDQQNLTIGLKNVAFLNNRDTISTKLTTIKVAGFSAKVTVDDCTFTGNEGTPIKIILGELHISGMTSFSDNIGLQGGAISLIFSKVNFANSTTVIFENNTALEAGGAIYVQQVDESDSCFYQLPYLSDEKDLNTHLSFKGNNASTGGDDIYGAALRDECSVTADVESVTITSNSIFEQLFDFINSSGCSIASDPKRVCLCSPDGDPVCDKLDYIYTSEKRYPGERFTVTLAVVGFEFCPVSAAVYANFIPMSDSTPSIDSQQRAQYVGNGCFNVMYSVESNSTEILVLSASHTKTHFYTDPNDIQKAINRSQETNVTMGKILKTPVFINITIDECPTGFRLVNESICECESLLENNNIISCTIVNKRGLVTRNGYQWIGNQSDNVIVSQYCPFGYCNTSRIDVDFDDIDQQCAEGRSGILCGQCKHNYSLMLGSSKCGECPDNILLSLLLAFIGAGFALVLVIKFLDLTVTMGTINGLIFYANIVWANQHILFSNKSLFLDKVLKVFIAWINLDFGIETCFFVGMNAYWKTWLQFVFPIYIWALCGLIIFIARHSVLATKVLGNNSISVLATLILLSYAKLLRTIIKALSFTYIETKDDNMVVWAEDGNIDYLRYDHAILFSLSLAMLVLFWMPYMMILLLVQLLKKVSHHGPLRLMNMWKPFFDAYIGHLKDRYKYWIGLLLLARGLTFIIVVVTSPIEPKVNLVVIAVVTAAIGLHPFVYTNWILSVLEKSFVFNLTVLACGVLYADYKQNEEIKFAIVITSIGITLIQFILILFFHLYLQISRCVNWKTNHTWQGRPIIRIRPEHDLRSDEEGYREPLLHGMEPRHYNKN